MWKPELLHNRMRGTGERFVNNVCEGGVIQYSDLTGPRMPGTFVLKQ